MVPASFIKYLRTKRYFNRQNAASDIPASAIEQRSSESCFNLCLSGKAENININCAFESGRFERVRVHIIVFCARVRASVTNREATCCLL